MSGVGVGGGTGPGTLGEERASDSSEFLVVKDAQLAALDTDLVAGIEEGLGGGRSHWTVSMALESVAGGESYTQSGAPKASLLKRQSCSVTKMMQAGKLTFSAEVDDGLSGHDDDVDWGI